MARSSIPPVWQLHEAKARFSEVFKRTLTDGPQRVTKQGGEAVVIISAKDFDEQAARADQPVSLVEFFQAAPTGGDLLDLRRKRDATRTIKW